jgi:hypothetical protein
LSSECKAPLDDYIFDTLMADLIGHDHAPSAFILFLKLVVHERRASGARRCVKPRHTLCRNRVVEIVDTIRRAAAEAPRVHWRQTREPDGDPGLHRDRAVASLAKVSLPRP